MPLPLLRLCWWKPPKDLRPIKNCKAKIEGRRIAGILNTGSAEAMLRVAVGLGLEDALDLAEQFGRNHPSDRMRLAGWEALAMAAPDAAARDRLWARAEAVGNRMIAGEARRQRALLPA